MLWDEGKIELDEKICSIFPERCNLMTSRKARSLTVEHLLTMSSGSTFREAGAVVESDWVRGFLESEFEFEPGTQNGLQQHEHLFALCHLAPQEPDAV